MEKKLVIALDGRMDPAVYQRQDIQDIINVVTKYGYQIEIVDDDGLYCDGDTERKAVLRIEKEGPNWVRHSQEYLKKIEDADVLVVPYSAVGKQLLEHAKKLKFVGVMRSGIENIDVEECKKRGIPVSNCPGRVSEPVAEMTVAFILDVVRGITYINKKWKPGDGFASIGMRKLMKDVTIGLVGFGIIAKKVVQKMKGFDCKFLAYDPFVQQEDADVYGVKMVELDQLMSCSDIVSVHARLLPETENLVGAEQLSLMKPTAYLINTARAGLVDEDALIRLLRDQRIQGAALDVFRTEPLPDDHILRRLDNVIITHHMAGGAGDPIKIALEIMFEEVERFVSGAPLQHQVNR